jgi:ATP-dependent DNA helicase RecQ
VCNAAEDMTGTHCESFDLDAGLRKLGYDRFRPGQQEAVEALLQERRLLLVAPTGGGKSLCYQLPAILLPGTTVVVSPLIALMHDQVQALEARGVAATFLASTLHGNEIRARMGGLRRGEYKIVYVAPERLQFEGFRGMLQEMRCPLIAIDEAHCISEWGHDFRPEYMKIGELLQALPNSRVLACTATATPVVRDEILGRLGLPDGTPQIINGFARPNLALRALDTTSAKERHALVDALLSEALGRPGARRGTAIIYAPTRRGTEEEAARLIKEGWRAKAYHAGMDGPTREAVQTAFIEGKLEIAVATNAFGMGIDRGDVRAVVHLAPPGSIESYYQEVGRAGRDGAPAWGLLLTSPSDMPLRRSLLERVTPGVPPPSAAVVEHKWNLFLELMRWAEGGSCRHDAILRYFGDEGEALHGCGRCDVCVALAGADAEQDPEHVTLMVRKVLSAVARIHGRFGLKAAVQLLRGEADDRLMRARLDQTRTFGILKDYPEKWLLSLLRRCVTAGWVDFVGGNRPLAILTEAGSAVMKGVQPARLLLPARQGARPMTIVKGRDRTPGAAMSAGAAEALDADAARVFEALRRHRLDVARDEKVPPYVVASDRTLRDLATLRPRNLQELKLAHGIGPAKADRFGAGLLRVIARQGRA